MSSSDSDRYDDPEVEASWLKVEHERVLAYLARQGVKHRGVPERPDWFLPPYLAVWRVGSGKVPGAVGWWAASGDIPTDYISSEGAPGPREALGKFADQWREFSRTLLEGRVHPELTLNCPPGEREFIGNLLLRRAEIAGRFVADDSMW